MSRLKRVVSTDGSLYGYRFDCPGCIDAEGHHDQHVVPTTGPKAWGFNGDIDRPTFTPSILVRASYAGGSYGPPRDIVCHSFVRDGQIQFLGDCTHALANQTIDLAEVMDKP